MNIRRAGGLSVAILTMGAWSAPLFNRDLVNVSAMAMGLCAFIGLAWVLSWAATAIADNHEQEVKDAFNRAFKLAKRSAERGGTAVKVIEDAKEQEA